MVALGLMLVPESMRELLDMSERICAAAVAAAVVVVEASRDTESWNSAKALTSTFASWGSECGSPHVSGMDTEKLPVDESESRSEECDGERKSAQDAPDGHAL